MSVRVKERKAQLPMMSFRADFAPASFDKEKRTIELVWSVGKKGLRYSWDVGDYYEELSMDPAHVRMGRFESGNSPFVDNHEIRFSGNKAVLGRILKASIADGFGRATVLLADPETIENVDAKDTIRKIESGIIVNCSVGYTVYRYQQQPEVAGEDAPTFLAVDWEPKEISAVPIGFDEAATVRGKEDASEPCVFINDLPESRNEEAEDMTEEQRKEMERVAAEKAKQDLANAEKAAAEKARSEEKARGEKIRSIFSRQGLDAAEAEKAIKDDLTIEKASDRALDLLAERSAAAGVKGANASVTAGKDDSEKFRDGVSQAIMIRSGAAVKSAVEKHSGSKLDGGEFRGYSLRELARMSLERAGVKTQGMDVMRMVGMALTHRAAFNTTSDFATLLENTMHKVLLAFYAVTPDTWTRFCRTGSVSDFRAHNRYRRGSFGSLDALTEHGEFKNKQIPDGEKASITASTKGNIIALSRQAIVNDDMGAFADLAQMLGRAAKLSVETDVYALLALNSGLGPVMSDGQVLFYARTPTNIGTGAALSAASVDADRVVMALQKDPSGNEILDLKPAVLLIAAGLGGQARVINQSQYDPDTVANKSQMKPNVVNGLYRDIVDTGRLTGTRRYSFADPAIAPVIEVAFLDGAQEPFLESEEGFRVDGVEWKCRLDYGVGAIDWRGAVTNAGA